jgi:4-aminobutyrate aminotransferase-like enzyme/Ser/Thr protein kinase RdoA (MazF antagonist)
MRQQPTTSPRAIDAVLESPPPGWSVDQAARVAADIFGVHAATADDVGSERDQTFVLLDADGRRLAVMKVSNQAESPDTLDMEVLAVRHVARVDADLIVAAPRRVLGTPSDPSDPADAADPAHHRAACSVDGRTHWARVYDVLPGRARADARTLDDVAIVEWGATTARLGRALRGFIHPRAIRTMPWDVQHAAATRPMLQAIVDASTRRTIAGVLDHYDAFVGPRWPGLRAQVVHGDLTIDNALIDDDGLITGIIDFGDMSHTALLVDIASVLDSLTIDRRGDDLFRVARLVLDGYQRVTPLDDDELAMVGHLWATRLAVGVAIGSWRAAEGLEESAFAQRFIDSTMATLDHLLRTGWAEVERQLGAPSVRDEVADLIARRQRVLGPAMESLSYHEPIRMASASGAWMVDVDGRRYLDAYNNVPCVGHAHPRVTSAIARQARLLNTNMRYLHGAAIELAERLTATCPPGLDTVFFVNSGSEANDLAWRLATHATGNSGGVCTAFAYHGISDAIAPMSPETLPAGARPVEQADTSITGAHIERWRPTDTYRDEFTDTTEFTAALDRLAARGLAPAAVILDGVLQSDGVYDLAPDQVQALVRLTHEAGGLWIADEVQGGHGRTGDAMWSFERFGIEPDFVTLGKPMGNGHPVAAVITRRAIAESFADETVFFSTFGGNQVSVAAAHAVLDVLRDERVLPRVQATGQALREALREATRDDDRIGDVRGMGLANAIEVVTDRASTTPDASAASAMKDGLRRHGVLVGTTGPHRNVLKVRPPLAFTEREVPVFVAALQATLRDLPVT